LKLQGKSVTLRWQRGEATDLKPDRTVAAGQWLRLADLPAEALVTIWSAI
jgi:hypothetical protein